MTTKGLKFSAETRAKMSAAQKARNFTVTPEHREKMVAGQRSAAQTLEYREAIAAPRRGKVASDETKAKMSAAQKGKPKAPEHCAAVSAAKRGVPRKTPPSVETRAKWVKTTRASWERGVYDNNPHPCWGKPGVHTGVRMDCLNSEGVFARDLDGAGIAWIYHPKTFKLSWCTYKPDFYLPEFDVWVDVKGYPEQPGNWAKKMETLRREAGKTIIIVYMRELSSLTYEKKR